jgi:hypothetical protein
MTERQGRLNARVARWRPRKSSAGSVRLDGSGAEWALCTRPDCHGQPHDRDRAASSRQCRGFWGGGQVGGDPDLELLPNLGSAPLQGRVRVARLEYYSS